MIFYDLESQFMSSDLKTGWDDIEAMKFGSCVTYNTKTDLYYFYDKDQKDKLIEDLTDNVCVGFNNNHFDNVILLGNEWRSKNLWYSYDIKNEITKQVFNVADTEEALLTIDPRKVHGGFSLDGICSKTLGIKKNDDTSQVPELIRNGEWSRVFQYNLNDIRLTKKLLRHITDNGYIRNGYGIKYDIKISKKIWEY